MSHTTKHGKITFIHNGDYSGVVEIIKNDESGYQNIIIPCESLFEFVADAVRDQRVGELEQSDYHKILGL